MAGLTPQPFPILMARAVAECERQRTIFDLPRRSFWQPASPELDLSVHVHGMRAQTPLGPAAGPHTQLAQNLVVSWLAGARVLELKTVQVQDRLEIGRPCIDAATVGYNVEWSQELRLDESAREYATAWYLIHAFPALGLAPPPHPGHAPAVFEASVGYDLVGIRSEPVARFLDTMADATGLIEGLRGELPQALRRAAEAPVPGRVSSCVTLSTFHGCPAAEIEQIVEHLFRRHGMSVVIKLNPTLLGFETTEELLRSRLGYDEIELDREAFRNDLRWDDALALFARLGPLAERLGLTLGAKFTNTLVVRNHRGALPGDRMYLSGAPLHVLAVTLADKFARATGGRIPLSLSGGVDSMNFADSVACGFAPVTTCTDLLRPNGYRRLPMYLRALEEEMGRLHANDIPGFILVRAGQTAGTRPAGDRTAARPGDGAAPAGADSAISLVRAAALENLSRHAARVASDPRYHAREHSQAPAHGPARLAMLDCESCNKCLLVCPNDAVFAVETTPAVTETAELEVRADGVTPRPARFEVRREKQWAVFADFCNECGNCATFCPEIGEPYRIKPRFHVSADSFEAAAPQDGILLEQAGSRLRARLSQVEYRLERLASGEKFSDGRAEVVLDPQQRVQSVRLLEPLDSCRVSLREYLLLRTLRDAALARVNAVSAVFLAAPGEVS